MGILLSYAVVHYVCAVALRGQKVSDSLRTGVTEGCQAPCALTPCVSSQCS